MDTLTTHVIAYVPALDAESDGVAMCIKGIGSYWHQLHQVWIVESTLTGKEIHDRLRGLLGPADRLLISRLDDDAVWQGFDWSGSEWLRRKLK